ncbi:MAG: BlaI/MecI/CopY family transcriptional regulator [Tissierellaceae bacterium]|nr:BlaI/MecI/CopY family transcriptional regulator [Tissierellaceae bacterium]
MIEYRLTEAEENLADIIWSMEPIRSPELVKICEEKFYWKKSTTYTMLKRLEEKNIVINHNSIVKSLIRKDDFHAEQSKIFIEGKFDGSLPKFLAAFTRRKKLSVKEVQELQKLINDYKEEV